MTITANQVNQNFQEFLNHYNVPREFRPGWFSFHSIRDYTHRPWSYQMVGRRTYYVRFHDEQTPKGATYKLYRGRVERFDAVDSKSVLFVEMNTSYQTSTILYTVYSVDQLQHHVPHPTD